MLFDRLCISSITWKSPAFPMKSRELELTGIRLLLPVIPFGILLYKETTIVTDKNSAFVIFL